MNLLKRIFLIVSILAFFAGGTACSPTVKVKADEPITINLNVNIQHEIRIKVEKDLEEVLSEDSGLF